MNCCGNKRAAWQQQSKSLSRPASEGQTPPATQGSSKVFEYTGTSSLRIQGVTGKTYHFISKGDKLQVDYQDAAAMHAERDLILVSETTKKTETVL